MNVNPNWIPMKWPSGPLEISRRARTQTLTSELKGTLEAWHDPAALELLRGAPVNCLIVHWAAGEREDREQQRTLKPLLEAGRRMALSFVGKVTTKEGQGAAIAAGLEAGLSAVLLEEPPVRPCDLPVILQSLRSKIPWDSAFPLLSATDNLWPGVALTTMREGDEAIAGPTGIPWVNSNGWFSLLARQLAGGRTLWLDFDPPASSGISHPADYCLAVADSQAYGSRWVISLDDKLRAGIIRKTPRATRLWDRIAAVLSFYKKHEEWSAFQPQSVLAVISDFRGENESLSWEVLNLLSRRHVQYQIIEKSQSLSASLEGLKAVVWLDREAPSAELQSKLLAFVGQGGLLIAASSWRAFQGTPIQADFSARYELRNLGKGRIAVAKEGFQDPYQAAVDTHLLMSRRNDLVRLYNAQATNSYCSAEPQRKRGLVQILNYSTAGWTDLVTLWVKTPNRSSRLWNLGAKDPVPIQGVTVAGGVEFHLPPISTYSALEFDDWNVQ
jgi:hypothetical protein